MAADSTAKREICKPYLLALYLWDERGDVCLCQTDSLKQYANRVGQERVTESRDVKEAVSVLVLGLRLA